MAGQRGLGEDKLERGDHLLEEINKGGGLNLMTKPPPTTAFGHKLKKKGQKGARVMRTFAFASSCWPLLLF